MYINTKAFYATAFKPFFKKSLWIVIFSGNALFAFNHVVAAAAAADPAMNEPYNAIAAPAAGSQDIIQAQLRNFGISMVTAEAVLRSINDASTFAEMEAALDAVGIHPAVRDMIMAADSTANLRDIVAAVRSYNAIAAPAVGNQDIIQVQLSNFGVNMVHAEVVLKSINDTSTCADIEAALAAAGIFSFTLDAIKKADPTANLRGIVKTILGDDSPFPAGETSTILRKLYEFYVDIANAAEALKPIWEASTFQQIKHALNSVGVSDEIIHGIRMADPAANLRGIVEAIRAGATAPRERRKYALRAWVEARATDVDTSGFTSGGRTDVAVAAAGGAGASATDHNNDFWTAAADGNTEKISALIRADTSLLHAVNRGGWTALHYAAAHGHLDTVVTLLGLGAAHNVRDDAGETPLMWAVRKGHKAIEEVLLSRE